MSAIDLTERVKTYAREQQGFDLVGVADALDPDFDRAPKGHKPTEHLPGARSVLVMSIRVLPAVLEADQKAIYNKHYTQLNEFLSRGSYQVARLLEDLGYRTLWLPETDNFNFFIEQVKRGETVLVSTFSNIAAAVAAGIGRRGRIGLVLTPQYGPRQRFICLITTAPLTPDPKFEGELCLNFLEPDSCSKCTESCKEHQDGALRPWPEEGGVDMLRCKAVSLSSIGQSCCACINSCPIGR